MCLLFYLEIIYSSPCLASSWPPSLGPKKQDKTRSWPICPPPPWAYGGNRVICRTSLFPMCWSQTCTSALETVQNRDNPWVISYLAMAVSEKKNPVQLYLPMHQFSPWEAEAPVAPEPSRVMAVLEKQMSSFLRYSLAAVFLGKDIFPYGNLLTDMVWTAFMGMAYFLSQWPPKHELLCPGSCFLWFPEEWRRLIQASACPVSKTGLGQDRQTKRKIGPCHISSSPGQWLIWHWRLSSKLKLRYDPICNL